MLVFMVLKMDMGKEASGIDVQESNSKGKAYYVGGIALIIVLAAVLVFLLSKPALQTTPQPGTSAKVSKFVLAYNVTGLPPSLSKSTSYYSISSQTGNSTCNKQTVFDYYSGNSSGTSYPYFISFSVSTINQSDLGAYSSAFYSNNGYCRSLITDIIKNSTSSVSNYTYDGVRIYRRLFTNFTSTGITLAQNEFIRGKSNLYWYMYTALYNNTKLEVAVWGASGYQNETSDNTYMDNFVSRYIASMNS